MRLLPVLPILIPLFTAAAGVMAWRWRTLQRRLAVAGAVALFITSVVLVETVRTQGIQVVQVGNWPAPFGITLVADMFSAIMVLMAGVIGLATVIYSLASIDARRESFGYYPLLHFLLMGVCGAFLTGDIFNLYVWFEVLLISSFVLLTLGGERAQMEGAIKYVTLNLMSSALFLAAVGILYGMTGTLNMADLAVKLNAVGAPNVSVAVAMLFLVAFGIKAAIFPLFFWLPASYHTPPVAVSAIFSGLLTKVGVYALIRVFTLLFVQDIGYTHTIVLVVAGFTMVTGVLGAAAQNEFRRILAFHIVSQIGYMIMGLGLFTKLGLAGGIFYIAHNIFAKTNLFLVSGVAYKLRHTFELKKLGGIYRTHPGISVLFLISALSLAGVPPLSGFFGKLSLVQAGLQVEQYAIAATALLVGILTLFSMTKIWNEAFWKASPGPLMEHAEPAPTELAAAGAFRLMVPPIIVLAALNVAMGVGAQFFFEYALEAADQLLNPEHYIQAVLGPR
jgi:multicomponent Na+:H+ antiporter subunit D